MRQSSTRHPIEVEGVGVLQHGTQKTYMFSVLWSDQNNVLIYRTYNVFKNFQKELKKTFPLEAGAMKKSDRIIPKLKDTSRTASKRKDSHKFLEKLHCLETYCQTLLRLDNKISQSMCVVQFFTLQKHDLNPSFPENSLVILPSEKKNEKRETPQPNQDISCPLIRASHLCKENFETVDLKNQPFKVKRQEILDVLIKESTGWWLVENDNNQIAWFPAPYLKPLRSASDVCATQECPEQGTFCVVVKAYEAQNEDELSVSIGVLVEVLKKSDNGWWVIRYNRRTGYIPSIYLKPYSNPCEKFQKLINRDLYKSTPNLYEGIQNREVYAVPNHRSSIDEQRLESGNTPGERERSRSLGGMSLKSDTIFVDSDIDSLIGSSTKSISDLEYHSSTSSSSCSIPNVGLGPGLPKIPARPHPDEIIQKCSTITRKAFQRSVATLNKENMESGTISRL
ncbi:NADPH oxidase organizer 1-like [Bombina bombina]|uniref:NADPH oxidase organizer 1-like n=1 Tax=Bombina bombina TaxID=8345 RepID=UPI00235AF39F|nr:NADPH oxidase organizer 1-like [Bombina bombina]